MKILIAFSLIVLAVSFCPPTEVIYHWGTGRIVHPKPYQFYPKSFEGKDYFCAYGEVGINYPTFMGHVRINPKDFPTFLKEESSQGMVSLNLKKYLSNSWSNNWVQTTCKNDTSPFIDVVAPFTRTAVDGVARAEHCVKIPETPQAIEGLKFSKEFEKTGQVGQVYQQVPKEDCPQKLCYNTVVYLNNAHAVKINTELESWNSIISNVVGTVCYDIVYNVDSIPKGYTLRVVESGYVNKKFSVYFLLTAPQSGTNFVPGSVKIKSLNHPMNFQYKIQEKVVYGQLNATEESYRADINLELEWTENFCKDNTSPCENTQKIMKATFSSSRGNARVDRRFPQFTQTYSGPNSNPFVEVSNRITNKHPFMGVAHTTNSDIAKGFKSILQEVRACAIKCGQTKDEDVIIRENLVANNELTRKVEVKVFNNEDMMKFGFNSPTLGYAQESTLSRFFDIYPTWEFKVTIRYEKLSKSDDQDYIETIDLIVGNRSTQSSDSTDWSKTLIIISSIFGGSIVVAGVLIAFVAVITRIKRSRPNYEQME